MVTKGWFVSISDEQLYDTLVKLGKSLNVTHSELIRILLRGFISNINNAELPADVKPAVRRGILQATTCYTLRFYKPIWMYKYLKQKFHRIEVFRDKVAVEILYTHTEDRYIIFYISILHTLPSSIDEYIREVKTLVPYALAYVVKQCRKNKDVCSKVEIDPDASKHFTSFYLDILDIKNKITIYNESTNISVETLLNNVLGNPDQEEREEAGEPGFEEASHSCGDTHGCEDNGVEDNTA